jgi:hypothetical protein
LAVLVGVEDLGLAMTGDGLLDGFEADVRGQRVGEPPGDHPAAGPIDSGHEIDEAPAHRDVGDVRGPDLVGPVDLQIPEQGAAQNLGSQSRFT